MKTYVADIIPSIQQFSKKLDNITMLSNQHWVVLDELTNSKTVYIFRTNGELLIAINGKVEKAKWEYLGHNSILIDLNEHSYLFKQGFFDENILALKVDSKDEYAILVNENKFQGNLNSISSVIQFLNNNYIINPTINNKQIEQKKHTILDITKVKEGYTFKMGYYNKFEVKFSTGKTFEIFQKKSNGKYYFYLQNEILLFPNEESCIKYLEEN